MTSEDSPFDWKEILQHFREAYTSEDSARENLELKYQSEHKAYSRLLAGFTPSVEAFNREEAEECHNVFDALSLYWNFGEPIPPELIDTILFLYRDRYLANGGDVSLEKTFFDQPGQSQYATKWYREHRDNLLMAQVQIGTQFEEKTKDKVLNEIADREELASGEDVSVEVLNARLKRAKNKRKD